MQLRYAIVMVAVLAAGLGCSKSGGAPAQPTQEQIEEMNRRQKEVNAEEGRREKQQPKTRPVDRAEEEERNRR